VALGRRREKYPPRAAAAGNLPTLSVVIPSAGRPLLARTLASVVRQVIPGDEVLVLVNDAWDWGNSARQEGQEKAKGDYVIFCDDDDVFVPGAFQAMRTWALEHPGRIGIFRRKSDAWPTQWKEPLLRPGNVQSSNFLIPNVSGKIGRWGVQSQIAERQAELLASGVPDWSDVQYVEETARLQGAEPIFVDQVTVYADPEPNPLRRLRYRAALGRRARGFLRR
jgi:glycosyltransferase involved in cell wall biosynthesis